MTEDARLEKIAWEIAKADPQQCGNINDSDMGIYFWEWWRDYYLILAEAALKGIDNENQHQR